MGELIVYLDSGVGMSIRQYPSIFSNIFSSKTTVPIELKIHMEIPKDRITKVCSNVPCLMVTMAAMPIFKNLVLKK